jgi:hypothetical protein
MFYPLLLGLVNSRLIKGQKRPSETSEKKPRNRWEDNIQMDVKAAQNINWTEPA